MRIEYFEAFLNHLVLFFHAFNYRREVVSIWIMSVLICIEGNDKQVNHYKNSLLITLKQVPLLLRQHPCDQAGGVKKRMLTATKCRNIYLSCPKTSSPLCFATGSALFFSYTQVFISIHLCVSHPSYCFRTQSAIVGDKSLNTLLLWNTMTSKSPMCGRWGSAERPELNRFRSIFE